MGGDDKKNLLVIGGGFSGLLVARDLHSEFNVTVVDAKEYFEYTPGCLRAYVKPSHFDALTFTLQDVLERRIGVKFLWGEVTKLSETHACVKPMFSKTEEQISFDYCVISSGCNFGPFAKWGESLWFPTIHEAARAEGSWPHIDERFIEGRRRHILEEYNKLKQLNQQKATVLVVGAGFIGVEWVTELNHFFPGLKCTIIDFLPRPLGPLPASAATYCENYMQKAGINTVYNVKYAPKEEGFWKSIGLDGEPDITYVCIGVKASNYFMPKETLTLGGPGGGGWISINKQLQVIENEDPKKLWAGGRIFAVGDCNLFSLDLMQMIPKISYPGEEQALHAVKSIRNMENTTRCCGLMSKAPGKAVTTWWPWGAGMFATSLGPDDACFVIAANHNKGSGYCVVWGYPCAIQKELIESTKVDECKTGCIGELIWHFVHHTPCHWFWRGPQGVLLSDALWLLLTLKYF